MILHRYFARRFLWSFAGVAFVFFMILGFINLIEQLRRFAGSAATFADILILTLLSLPQAIYNILPLIMIIAAITLFLGLARSSEMVVTRASGRSAMRALWSPLAVALVLGTFAVGIFNPIVAATSRQFEAREDALRGESAILSIGATGLWLRQGNAEGQTVIRASRSDLAGTTLDGVTFLTFAPEGGPLQRIEARRATLIDGAWKLDEVKIWPLSEKSVAEANAVSTAVFEIPSTLTADQIRDSFGTPASIPIWELPTFIDKLTTAGFSAQRHQVWFQMELALPLFLVAMVMIAAAFTLRHQRGGRTGLMVLYAILMSFSIYFIRNFAQILGENGQLPAILAAWAPPFAAIGLSMGLLLHHEDG